ncbi:purine-cytosine permease family protein [Nocardioides sp.]|uniref:purine-cytosine permease family protein n=1 Tax=Nocardioides sp. TaxID=35761 RepID=UPI003784611D
MSEAAATDANPLFGVETHGFEHIPEAERKMTLRETAFFWVGTNANLFFVSVGAIAVALGLQIWQAVLACILGNLLFVLVGYASVAGVRAGLPAMTFTRATFGLLGNRPNALLAWVASVAFEAINTIFGVYALLALMELLGWQDPGTPGKLLAVFLQFIVSGGVAVLGHATMLWFQRIFAVLLSVALVLVFAFSAGDLSWHVDGALHGSAALATFTIACAIIASGPISYLYNCPDWVRYLPSQTRSSSVVWTVTLSGGLTALLLCIMGALLAGIGDMSDPVAGVKAHVPTWAFLLYTIAAAGGSIANNVVTYYSSGLALQSMGVPLHRYVATALDAIVSTGIVLYILFVQDFTTALNSFVSLLIVWLGPFAGVWIADGLRRRWRYDYRAVHVDVRNGRGTKYWYWRGINLTNWTAMLAGVVACLLTVDSPAYVGVLSNAWGGADLSWIVGLVVGAGSYLLLTRFSQKDLKVEIDLERLHATEEAK